MADVAAPIPGDVPPAAAPPRASRASKSSGSRMRHSVSDGSAVGDASDPGEALRKKSSGRSKKASSSGAGGAEGAEGAEKDVKKSSVRRRPAAGNRRTAKWDRAAAPEGAADANAAAAAPAEGGEEAAGAPGQRAVSSSAPADTRPCMAFAIGEEVLIKIATVARKEESTESAEVKQLQKGASCQILEYGREATGRRLKIVDLDSGLVGWISCVGRGSGNPIIKSSGKPIQHLPPNLEANSSGQRVAEAIAASVSEAQAAPAGAPTQSPDAFFDPNTVARNKAVAASAEPAQPAPEPDPEMVNRTELIQKLFDLLDTERKKRLDVKGLRTYAALCGFSDSEEQWAREYDALCTLYGWDSEKGATVTDFAQLIDDEEGAAFCTDDELISVLEEIDQFGVPVIQSALQIEADNPDMVRRQNDVPHSPMGSEMSPHSPAGSDMGPTMAARVPDDLEITSNFSNPLRSRDPKKERDKDEVASVTSGATSRSRFSKISGVLSSASNKFKPSSRNSTTKKTMDTE